MEHRAPRGESLPFRHGLPRLREEGGPDAGLDLDLLARGREVVLDGRLVLVPRDVAEAHDQVDAAVVGAGELEADPIVGGLAQLLVDDGAAGLRLLAHEPGHDRVGRCPTEPELAVRQDVDLVGAALATDDVDGQLAAGALAQLLVDEAAKPRDGGLQLQDERRHAVHGAPPGKTDRDC